MNAIKDSIGKTIESIQLVDDNLYINFTDGLALRLWDGGSKSYMTSETKLVVEKNTILINVWIKSITNEAIDLLIKLPYKTLIVSIHDYIKLFPESEITEAWTPRF